MLSMRGISRWLGGLVGMRTPTALSAPPNDERQRRLFEIVDRLRALRTSELSSAQQAFLDVWELEEQVNNGGFDQYFFNNAGSGAGRIESSLRQIGAARCSKIAADAVHLVDEPSLDWSDTEARRKALFRLDEQKQGMLEELDRQFFSYPDDLSLLLDVYAGSHPADFGDVR
jgi:hypothetical protein